MVDDDGCSELDALEVADDMNDYLMGASFSYNNDGTGSRFNPENGTKTFIWSLNNEVLSTVGDEGNITNTYLDVKSDNNKMVFMGRLSTLHFRDSISYSVTHTGSYMFKKARRMK